MATIVEIPIFSDTSAFEISVILDGAPYTLSFSWNTRSYNWFFSLADINGSILAAGRKVVPNRPLLQRDTNALLPPGDLWLYDKERLGASPGLRDLGKRHRLLYVVSA